ncbi:MAG: single-stranded-DNA-specific exonuclease RecJ [Cyanobacteriota bacterium]|nr:single-stranded-DNA-specific exonuclease RecJ [Cyanobacteriota bacterium]
MQNYPISKPSSDRLPDQRWFVYPEKPELATEVAEITELSPLLAQVLINRNIETPAETAAFLDPESIELPSPLDEFPDLPKSIELLETAITQKQKIAICGDYDADGMTSTALLIRAFRHLGAIADYAIPSRMREGYGINERIVEDFHAEDIRLILTVDNGIAAHQPIARARELGLDVIITDHHDLPPTLPEATAILNPKLIAETSPYRGLAGVGVAYVLAISLAQRFDAVKSLTKPLLELFTLGTIADLAPLTGVNRRWVKRGLRLLPRSGLVGVKALIQRAGITVRSDGSAGILNPNSKTTRALKPEDIGFRLGPRINAVGRLDDPQIVIELLTTEDVATAMKRAGECELINQRRQQLCEEIEKEAIALCEKSQIDLQQERVLVLVEPDWHHGVIGIVASRLVERYGAPVFIGTYEEGRIRGSARGIPEFNIFEALQYCDEVLGKYGGHKAAGGFSLPEENLERFRQRLSTFARRCLEPRHLKPLVAIDVEASFNDIDLELYHQIDAIHPCGIENQDPTFWTPNVRVIEQKIVGKGHIKLTLATGTIINGIAWRWSPYFPLPPVVDIAYKLQENTWNGSTTVQLELVGVRLPASGVCAKPASRPKLVEFVYSDRPYTCTMSDWGEVKELKIRNAEGKVLAVRQGEKIGLLGKSRLDAKEVNVSEPFFFNLIKTALAALER